MATATTTAAATTAAGQKAQKAARKRFNETTLTAVSSELRKSSFEGRIEFYKALGYNDVAAIQAATLYYTNMASTFVAAQGGNVVACSFDFWSETEYTISVTFWTPKNITLVEAHTFLVY